MKVQHLKFGSVKSKERIIIVDDDQIIHYTTRHFMDKVHPGVEVVSCMSAEEGIAELQVNKFGILFLDINMPEMDGWTLLDTLIKQHAQIPKHIFILSSSIDPDEKKRAEDHPLKPIFIEKPLTVEKIRALEVEIS
jgi:CheY-like chemotaxis protein